MVNLSEAKSGDVVHFRCGGSAEINEIMKSGNMLLIEFVGSWNVVKYYKDGSIDSFCELFDIVKVERK